MEKSDSHIEESEGLKAPRVIDIGHQFRTPLNSILGYAELLSHGLYGPLNSEQEEAVRNIIGCGKQLLELINDVLDLTKFESNLMALAMEVSSPRELVQSVASTIEPLATRKNLRISVSCEADLPPLRMDGRQMRQALMSLARSVLESSRSGTIQIRAYRRGNEVEFSVGQRDIETGAGEQPSGISEFPQAGDVPPSSRLGGLWLDWSRRLIELHRGTLRVELKGNQTKIFSFTLPIDGHLT